MDTSGALDPFASGSGGLGSNMVGAPITNGVDLLNMTTNTGGSMGALNMFPFVNAGAAPGTPLTPTLPFQSTINQVPGAGAIAGGIMPYLIIGGFFLAAVLLMTR